MNLEKVKCLIDLHIHLDGSLSLPLVRKLSAMQKFEIPSADEDVLRLLSVDANCKNLNEYLDKFDFSLSLLQTKESISIAVSTLLSELKEAGLIYAELRFAPQKHKEKGLTQREVIEAAIEGMQHSSLKSNLILCCMRGNSNFRANLETVQLAAEYLGKGVAGLDLAGAEALYPTKNFENLFSLARRLGIPFTIHAGEADGPDSVKKAVECGATRIGHGVRAAEDTSLLKYLAQNSIVLECCPTSNLQTCVFDSISDFPIPTFIASGIPFTINTDNLSVSATSLFKEWELVIDSFSLSETDMKNILLTSADAAFAEENVKEYLKNEILRSFSR